MRRMAPLSQGVSLTLFNNQADKRVGTCLEWYLQRYRF